MTIFFYFVLQIYYFSMSKSRQNVYSHCDWALIIHSCRSNNNSDDKWVEVLQKDSYEGVFYTYRQGKLS